MPLWLRFCTCMVLNTHTLSLLAGEGISTLSSEDPSGLLQAELTPAWGPSTAVGAQLHTTATTDLEILASTLPPAAAAHITHGQPPAQGGLETISHVIVQDTTLDQPAPTVLAWLKKDKQPAQAMVSESSLEQDVVNSCDSSAESNEYAEAGGLGADVQEATARSVLEDKQLFLSWFVKKLDLLTMLRLASGELTHGVCDN